MSVWKPSRTTVLLALSLALGVGICGCLSQIGLRQFATPPEPATDQEGGMVVQDDGSIVFIKGRLEISLQVLADDYLNRQFPESSSRGTGSTNPYTYGNWKPWGQEWTPNRFTVALIKVKNYEFPKIYIEPETLHITTANRRHYDTLNPGLLEDYFSPYLQSYVGQSYRTYEEITDRLKRTLYPGDLIFSGQEATGYVIFPVLHSDVTDFTVHVPGVVLRFDYKSEPVETIDLAYQFQRELYKARHPREALQ